MSTPPVVSRLRDLHVSPTAAVFEGGAHGGGGVSLFVTRTPPGRFVELHTHPYPETFLLLEGHGRWTADDAVVELAPDEVIVIPAGTLHGFRNVGEHPLLVVSVHEAPAVEQTWTDREPA